MKKLSFVILVLGLVFCNAALTKTSLPECKGNDIKGSLKKFIKIRKWTNCHGTFLDLKGKPAYVGEFYKGKFHGQGTFEHSGRKYVGQWKKGKKHGRGTYTYPNGDKYVGEWKNDKYHRKGTYTYANGDRYVGEWKKGLRHGRGIFTHANGIVKEGTFINNELVKQQ